MELISQNQDAIGVPYTQENNEGHSVPLPINASSSASRIQAHSATGLSINTTAQLTLQLL